MKDIVRTLGYYGYDYDSTMVNDFIAYDSEGNRIAWDNWMPDEQTKYLNDIIRNTCCSCEVR